MFLDQGTDAHVDFSKCAILHVGSRYWDKAGVYVVTKRVALWEPTVTWVGLDIGLAPSKFREHTIFMEHTAILVQFFYRAL